MRFAHTDPSSKKSPPLLQPSKSRANNQRNVRNSDLAKFGSSKERATSLWEYSQRRVLPYGKTTEKKAAEHIKESMKKWSGKNKILCRSSDSVFLASLTSSNIKREIVARKPTKLDFKQSKKGAQTKATTFSAPPQPFLAESSR